MTATIIKATGILFQYGLLLFLLMFIYKTIKYIKQDIQPMIDEAYSTAEINNGEAVISVIEAGDESLLGRRFAFSNELTFGRGNNCDIKIVDSFVSHNHARIYMVNNQYVLEDLGSSNGTYLNGERLNGRSYLQTGDSIAVGTVTFEFAR